MDIREIINEEYQKILKEGYVFEDDKLKFTQQLQNSTFYNYQNFSNDYDVEISESQIIVNWRIGFWVNDMGIENFMVQADNVEGMYKVILRDKQTDEISQEIEKNIGEIPWKFKIEYVDLKIGDSLYIEKLDFDFQSKICNVIFYLQNNQ